MGELKFSWIGFGLIQCASMASGIRWSLTQVMMQGNKASSKGGDEVTNAEKIPKALNSDNAKEQEGLKTRPLSSKLPKDYGKTESYPAASSSKHPLEMIRNLSPAVAVCLGVGCAMTEMRGPDSLWSSTFFTDRKKAWELSHIIIMSGLLALLMTLAQYYLINNTGVVTFSVSVRILFAPYLLKIISPWLLLTTTTRVLTVYMQGIFKVVFMLALSAIFFGDQLTTMGVAGMALSITGIGIYTYMKFSSHKQPEGKKEKVN
ncbi:Triose-phosphate Transporter [Chytridiales sp. JEL 0842]|nr:Triose-phosphate Transporter [Chytridiales sp. JEL 0842]